MIFVLGQIRPRKLASFALLHRLHQVTLVKKGNRARILNWRRGRGKQRAADDAAQPWPVAQSDWRTDETEEVDRLELCRAREVGAVYIALVQLRVRESGAAEEGARKRNADEVGPACSAVHAAKWFIGAMRGGPERRDVTARTERRVAEVSAFS